MQPSQGLLEAKELSSEDFRVASKGVQKLDKVFQTLLCMRMDDSSSIQPSKISQQKMNNAGEGCLIKMIGQGKVL
jgi:hypothetical protein